MLPPNPHLCTAPNTLLIKRLKIRIDRGCSKLQEVFGGVRARTQQVTSFATPRAISEVIGPLTRRNERQNDVAPAALRQHMSGEVVGIEPMGDDDDAPRP